MRAMKIVATIVSYASGNAGGIFAPSLYLGAMVGGVIGLLAQWRLYEKAKQPGWTCLVPGLNFIV